MLSFLILPWLPVSVSVLGELDAILLRPAASPAAGDVTRLVDHGFSNCCDATSIMIRPKEHDPAAGPLLISSSLYVSVSPSATVNCPNVCPILGHVATFAV